MLRRHHFCNWKSIFKFYYVISYGRVRVIRERAYALSWMKVAFRSLRGNSFSNPLGITPGIKSHAKQEKSYIEQTQISLYLFISFLFHKLLCFTCKSCLANKRSTSSGVRLLPWAPGESSTKGLLNYTFSGKIFQIQKYKQKLNLRGNWLPKIIC